MSTPDQDSFSTPTSFGIRDPSTALSLAVPLMPVVQRPEPVMSRGLGSYLWDEDGKRYLDVVQGWASIRLGTQRRRWWSRSKAKLEWWFLRTAIYEDCASSPIGTIHCWCWMKCRPAWGGLAHSWPQSETACAQTSPPSARGWGADYRSAPSYATKRAACFGLGDNGSTHGGNPLLAQVGLAMCRVVANPGFLEAVRDRGAQLEAGLRQLARS